MNNDLISRSKLREAFEQAGEEYQYQCVITMAGALATIDAAEPCQIDELSKQGKWEIRGKTTLYYACSECGNAGDLQDKFCRHCGAHMKGEENANID